MAVLTLASISPAVAQMLRGWDYKEGSGLGSLGQGIVAPVQAAVQSGHPRAGIGYGEEPFDNGLNTTPPVVQEEWRRRAEELSRALALEVECCDKILVALRGRSEERRVGKECRL